MTFAETYREERLINRRSRGRKARIAGRIIGFGLTALLVVALRTDPQLRSVVEDLAMKAMGISGRDQTVSAQTAQTNGINALGYAQGSQEAQVVETLGIAETGEQDAPAISRMPQSRVKINRPGSG
jgi:hypothetical protein